MVTHRKCCRKENKTSLDPYLVMAVDDAAGFGVYRCENKMKSVCTCSDVIWCHSFTRKLNMNRRKFMEKVYTVYI